MARGSTLSVSLTQSLDKYVRDKVASGKYESASEVIRESLRLAKSAEEQERAFWRDVNAKVEVGCRQLAEGKTVDGEAAMDEIIAELSRPLEPKRAKARKR